MASMNRRRTVQNLALEADTAISLANTDDQNFLKRIIANKLKAIAHNSSSTYHSRVKSANEKKILRNLKDKLVHNNACIAKADKGKTIVVLNVTDPL
jgi:hypothetical protein